MTVYICGPDFESILCGVYDGWMSQKGHDHVKLIIRDTYQDMDLFSEYREVHKTEEKMAKVRNAVLKKLSAEVYETLYVASLSQEEERADRIYRFLVQAFRQGPQVLHLLQIPEVYQIFSMCRNIWNENHRFTEFIRFSQTTEQVLLSRIRPQNDILPLLSPHFADRLPEENWIIYDENRKKASIHPRGGKWLLVNHALEQEDKKGKNGWRHLLEQRTDEQEYSELWKTFHETVAIQERFNPRCQRTHLPLRFRNHMTEFRS